MSDEYVECTIKIPRACLESNGKRYKPTGEFRPVRPGEYAISGSQGTAGRYGMGCAGHMIIVEEMVEAKPTIPTKPESFLVTNGNEYVWAFNDYPTHFADRYGVLLLKPAWRRVTPEELKALGLEDTQ